MPLDEKRELYRCGKDFVTLESILPWSEYLRENVHTIFRKKRDKKTEKPSFEVNEGLNEKISLWRGDITTLEIDGIVNAGSVLIAVFVCFVLLFGCSGHSELLFAVPFHLHG